MHADHQLLQSFGRVILGILFKGSYLLPEKYQLPINEPLLPQKINIGCPGSKVWLRWNKNSSKSITLKFLKRILGSLCMFCSSGNSFDCG